MPARSRITIELTSRASGSIDAALTRNLIMLELAEVQVSPFVDEEGNRLMPALFFRVDVEGDQALVELWERGRLYGSRRLSLQGGAQLKARRIALSALELGRRLREHAITKSLASARKRAQEEAEMQAYRQQMRELAPEVRPLVFHNRVAPQAWLLGVGADLVLHATRDLSLHFGWALGQGTWQIDGRSAPLVSWELSMAPSYAYGFSKDLSGELRLRTAASVLRALGEPSATMPRGTEWTAKVSLEPALLYKTSERIGWGVRPELGWILRQVPARSIAAESADDLGGAVFGASMFVSVTLPR